MASAGKLVTAAGFLLGSCEDRGSSVWKLFLLSFVVFTAVLYVVSASRLHEINDNDGAYYYGVARHIALTGRFEEPIVWHFIHPPDHIIHAPFDYWGCMTSLLLVPALVLFGATPETAFLTMSAVSAASVLAFWYLICVALPLRYRVTQLLALVLFAFSPAMHWDRFQPESTAVAQLFLLLSLIAFCRRRFVLAILSGFCILLSRGDGIILFGLIFLAVLLQGWRNVDGQRRRFWALPVVGLACVGGYVLWSWVSFGTLTPPASQTLPFLESYTQIFDFGGVPQRSFSQLLDWFTWHYLVARVEMGMLSLRIMRFAPDWWLAMALVPVLGMLRRRPASESLIWVLCFGGFFLVAWVSGPGYNSLRAPHMFTPLVILSGALGVDVIVAQLDRWVKHGQRIAMRRLFAGAAVLAMCVFFLSGIPVFTIDPRSPTFPVREHLTQLDRVLGGEPVASNVPWYMIAYTRSPTVSIPYNGEAAIAAVLERYQVRWLVIFGKRHPRWVGRESQTVLRSILDGSKTNLAQFRLERVPVPVKQAVFRVTGPRGRADEVDGTGSHPPPRFLLRFRSRLLTFASQPSPSMRLPCGWRIESLSVTSLRFAKIICQRVEVATVTLPADLLIARQIGDAFAQGHPRHHRAPVASHAPADAKLLGAA